MLIISLLFKRFPIRFLITEINTFFAFSETNKQSGREPEKSYVSTNQQRAAICYRPAICHNQVCFGTSRKERPHNTARTSVIVPELRRGKNIDC